MGGVLCTLLLLLLLRAEPAPVGQVGALGPSLSKFDGRPPGRPAALSERKNFRRSLLAT